MTDFRITTDSQERNTVKGYVQESNLKTPNADSLATGSGNTLGNQDNP